MGSGNLSRRDFVLSLAGLKAALRPNGNAYSSNAPNPGQKHACIPGSSVLHATPTENQHTSGVPPSLRELIWAQLVHLSFNMWLDREAPEYPLQDVTARPYLRFDMPLWNELLRKMVEVGLNMVVLDLGDAVAYESHPEIAVRGAWSVDQLRRELEKARKMGLEVIPKLNFSAGHDVWLGPYARCVSTDAYYRVCKDLIAEVIQIFDKPRLFHLGMDEEAFDAQKYNAYVVVRQNNLWWHDFNLLCEAVEGRGVRPWIWSDQRWIPKEIFFKRMPKSVLQSAWHYGEAFDELIPHVKAYLDLEAQGYDQIPCGSNTSVADNFAKTVAFAKGRISPEHLWGFLQTTWKPTLPQYRRMILEAAELAGKAKAQMLT